MSQWLAWQTTCRKSRPCRGYRSHPETWVLAMSQGHECPDISHPLSTEEAIPHTHGPHKLPAPPSGKSLGGLTTGPRPQLTSNLTPSPREASIWYTCQMSIWDSAGGQVGSLMPGAWPAKAPAPSADSLGIDPSCSGLLHTGLNSSVCPWKLWGNGLFPAEKNCLLLPC